MTRPTDAAIAHPIQPLVMTDSGVIRFKANAIVRYLLDNGGISMNDLAVEDFTREDREQFAQLIGYSHSGSGDLSYMSDAVWYAAQDEYEARTEKLTTSPERVQIPAESEHVAHDDWFCEQHPWEVMGHDGCDGAGMLDCARWPMAQHIIRMRDQEIRELHQQYGFLAKHALAESGEMTGVAPYNRCPTCTAHMPVGKTCGGVNCGLRRTE